MTKGQKTLVWLLFAAVIELTFSAGSFYAKLGASELETTLAQQDADRLARMLTDNLEAKFR